MKPVTLNEQIKEVARQLMAECGFEEVTAHQIARSRLGLPVGDVFAIDPETGEKRFVRGRTIRQDGTVIEFDLNDADKKNQSCHLQ